MGEIDSEIGGRKFQSSVSKRKLTVPDESEHEYYDDQVQYNNPAERLRAAQRFAQEEAKRNATEFNPHSLTQEEMMAAREQRKAQMHRASDHARHRIELLAEIGRATSDIVVNSGETTTTFSIRTLKSREVRNLLLLANKLAKAENPDVLYTVREKTLALSIFAIDGVGIDTVLGTEGLPEDECIQVRSEFLNELDDTVINYIYSEYQKLNSENAQKYGIRNADDAKEVAEQMKKSGERE